MPTGREKSRSRRRVFRRTPKGEVRLHYRRKKPSKQKCSSCGSVLLGTPALSAGRLKKMPRSSRRPERPYGGKLCTACARREAVKKARSGEQDA